MPDKPLHYILSREADEDLVSIYDYTLEQFGQAQAVTYLSNLDSLLDDLCQNPLMGRERTDIREGLRSLVYESHVSFYPFKTVYSVSYIATSMLCRFKLSQYYCNERLNVAMGRKI